ncbi:MAG: ATP-binding protein [Candidatus Berkiellales bacterium]
MDSITPQIKEIILDFQGLTLETGVPRHLEITPIRGKATICIGVRRSGKSTMLYQIIDKLQQNGVPKENILYLNFFDERLHRLEEVGLGVILEAYFSLYPEKKNAEKIYCFFDEIQIIEGWEPFVDRVIRMEKSEVYITGSSAKLLSKEIATQMRGRSMSWEIFPFSFKEFLDYKEIDSREPFSTKKRLLIQNAFEDYWEKGSFPEVVGLEKSLRIKVLQEYFNSVLYRDLIERHDIAHPKAVIDLARWLIDNNGSLYSINNLTGYLKSLGHKISKSTVSDYLAWFEDAYFFFNVKIFDSSLARVHSNPKKIYCIDLAMVNAVSSGIMINSGRLLENLVFIALRRMTTQIFYHKTQSGLEIDFIAQMHNRKRLLIQVCESLTDPKTKSREISALNEAMLELNIKSAMLVTRNQEGSIEVQAGRIDMIPAWRFLLEKI